MHIDLPKIWVPEKPAIVRAASLKDVGRATFPFPMFIPGSLAPATVTATANATNTSSQTTYTFSAQSIGTAAANRVVVVGVGGRNASGGTRSITSFTIGGNGATQIVYKENLSSAWIAAAMYELLVPSGITADIVVTWSIAPARCGIGVWAVTASSETATASASSVADPASMTLDVQAGGVVIGYDITNASGTPTFTWNSSILGTEDFDTGFSGATTGHTGASKAYSTLQTGLNITCTPTSSSKLPAAVVAAFR